MNSKRHLILCALIAVILIFTAGAINAEDSSNTNSTSDIDDILAVNEISDDIIDNHVDNVLGAEDDKIYVDANYAGEETGTADKPYTTISKAVTGSSENKSTIYVKNGEYAIPSTIKLPTTYGISFIGESKDNVIFKGTYTSTFFMFTGTLNNFDLSFTNITFTNAKICAGFKIEGTGNFIMDNCVCDGLSKGIGTYIPFSIYCTNSTIRNTRIINLDVYSNAKTAYITYRKGNHKIENTTIDTFSSPSRSLNGGLISVEKEANLETDKLTVSNINTAMLADYGLIMVAGKLTVKDSTIKNNELSGGSLLYINNGTLKIETSSISHNTGFDYFIKEITNQNIVNISYTGIMGNIAKNNFIKGTGTNSFDYNWWGTNDKPNDYVNNWVLMNLTFNRAVGDVSINANFTEYTDGNNINTLEKNLNFPIIIKSSHGTVDGEFYLKNNIVSVNFESDGDFYVDIDTGSKKTYLFGVYYVNSNYSGDETGTEDKPFKNISTAVANCVGWETIYIKNGNYTVDNVITLSNSLSFIGESEDNVIITGSNKGIFNNPSYLSKELTISFTNLTFKNITCNANNAALTLGSSVKELNIENCTFDNCSGRWGSINTECLNLNMDQCKILNSKSTATDTGASAISINGNGNYIIKNTVITECQYVGDNVNSIILCRNNNALLTLDNVEIINNTLSASSIISGGKLNVNNSKFKNNKLNSQNSNLIDVACDSLIQNTEFISNTGSNLISIETGTQLELNGNTIENNTVDNVIFADKNSNLTVKNNEINGNSAGNVIFVEENNYLTIIESHIKNNTGNNIIIISKDCDVKTDTLDISNNIADNLIVGDSGADINLNNIAISNNNAFYALSTNQTSNSIVNNANIIKNNLTAIFNSFTDSNLTINESTISNNNVRNILTVENGSVDFENSIISDNDCSDELICNNGANTHIVMNYNLIYANNEKSFINAISNYNFDYNWWGTNDKPNDFADKWAILDPTVVRDAGKAKIEVTLNKYTDGTNVDNLTKNLPDGVLVKVESSTKDFTTTLTIQNGVATTNFDIGNNKYVTFTSNLANIIKSLEPITYYVNVNYAGNGTGSIDAPFNTLNAALDVAQDGDTIFLKEGTYSEKISIGGSTAQTLSGKGVNLIGENNKVVINLTKDTQFNTAANNIKLVNITFIGNGARILFAVSKGTLEVANCTFDGFNYGYSMTTRGLFYLEGANSNIENCKFINSNLSEKAIAIGFILQYSGSGTHSVKNCLFDNLTHYASSSGTYSRGIIYVGSAKVTLDIDNITISNTYSDAECIIGNGASYTTLPGGIVNIRNSKFINNTVHRYKIGTTEYAGSSLFYNTKGKLTIETSIIKDNNGSLYLIFNRDAASDSIFNYNAIYDNTFSTGIATTTGKHDFNYNWWNSATPGYADANTWVIFDAYITPDNIMKGDEISIAGTYNHYITKDGTIGDLKHVIPIENMVTFIFQDGSSIRMNTINGEAKINYTCEINENITVQGNGLEKVLEIKLSMLTVIVDENIIPGQNTDIVIQAPNLNLTCYLIIDRDMEVINVNGSATKTIENIQAGNHSIIVLFKRDKDTNFNVFTKTFTVEKLSTKIELDNITVNANENITIKVNIAPDATGKIIMSINEIGVIDYLTNGETDINIADLVMGNYTANIAYEGDGKYLPCNTTITITINGLNSNLKANASNITVGENATLDIEINQNVTGNVYLTINGKTYLIIFADGKSSLEISDLTNGIYPVLVKFEGDEKFLEAQVPLTIVVTKTDLPSDTKLTTNIPEGTTAPEFTIKLPTDATGNLTVTVDKTTYTQKLYDGTATVKFPELAVGNHTVSASYTGDDKYNKFEFGESILTVPQVDIPDGEDRINMTTPVGSATPSYSINLPADATGNLTVTVDGKDRYTQKVEKGFATVDVPKLTPGNHDITVAYTGDVKYSDIVKETTLTVDKFDSNLKADSSNIKVGENATVNIEIDQEATGKVVLTINEETYPVTFTEGKASITIQNLTNGTHTALVKFEGDEKFLAANVSLEINVSKIELINDTTIGVNIQEGSPAAEFTIKLPTDATGNLTVTVDKTTYTQKLVNGFASVNIEKLTSGDHNITVTYSGDGKYSSISRSTYVNVKPATPAPVKLATKISANKKKYKAKVKVKKYKITLKAGKKGVSNAQVTLKVKGKTYKAKTNVKGKATFKINKLTKKGKYTAVIKFKGNENYKPSSKKVKITIKK